MPKKILSLLLYAAFFQVAPTAAYADAPTSDQVRANLPSQLSGPVTDIKLTKIKGLYQVTVSGRIVYYHSESQLTFVGDLVTNEGRSLTAEERAKGEALLAAPGKKLLDANLDKALKIGNGKHTIVEITDPDCPYCRKLDSLLKVKDVTRYIFFRPLPIHPTASAKVEFILGAAVRQKAFEEVFRGDYDQKSLPAGGDGKALAGIQSGLTDKIGIGGTPLLWIDGEFVHGLNAPRIEELLK
jgi:thiol:disulfide interchange protein DsbC